MGSTFEEGMYCLVAYGQTQWLLIDITFMQIDYKETVQFFKSKNMDVAICDHFTVSCQEACHTLQIPFLVTSSIGAAPDTEAPYIDSNDLYTRALSNLDTSFLKRFHDQLILPIKAYLNTYTLVQEQRHRCLALGIRDPVFSHQE